MPRKDLIAVRRGTAAEWTAANPVLAAGEPGLETDTGIFKVGDGQTPWLSLNDVRGVIAHDWGRDGWAPFQQVAITAHGSQQFDLDVAAGRGVVTGPGPEGSHRVALLRQGTLWSDAEVRSVVWGPLDAWTGNNAQQGHLHRVRQIGPNLWEGIAVWTSVVFGQDMRFLHVASVRWDGTTLWQSTNDGGAGSNDSAWIDRRLPLVSASRIEGFGLIFTRLGILPPHGWGIQSGTVVTVDAEDDSLDAVDVPIQGVDPVGFLQLQYGDAVAPLTVARGLVTPSGPDSQRRWCPFGLATRVVGGDAGAVVVEIKRWRAGWDPEPGWDDPRVMRAEVTPDSGGNVPEMALGPGLHGLWAAHFYDGSSGAWGPVTFTRLDQQATARDVRDEPEQVYADAGAYAQMTRDAGAAYVLAAIEAVTS